MEKEEVLMERQDSSSSVNGEAGGANRFAYEVFLSFRGEDTRGNFTGFLRSMLVKAGVKTFMDDDGLEKGHKIDELFDFIEKSQLFIPIFSTRYADSKWCLKEIAKIAETKRAVIPVFFDVEPTAVRNQKGPFKAAFDEHEVKEKEEVVKEWRSALNASCSFSGYELKAYGMDQAKLVDLIVQRVTKDLKDTLNVANHPVSVESFATDLKDKLKLSKDKVVIMAGVHGMAGIGKSSITKALYNMISRDFSCSSFISHVGTEAKKNGIASLQRKIIQHVNRVDVPIDNDDHGISELKRVFQGKTMLLVLDGVDSREQINFLCGDLNWFHPGSRVIVSSRNEMLLRQLPSSSRSGAGAEPPIYKAPFLDLKQSLKLFSLNVFGSDQPLEEYLDICNEIMHIAGGLPLAIEEYATTFSSFRSISEWKEELKRMRSSPEAGALMIKRLKESFEGLDSVQQHIFLDIACFFVGKGRAYARMVWQDAGLPVDMALKVLKERCLLEECDEVNGGEFYMHEQIKAAGRYIVEQEDQVNPMQRSRIWKLKDAAKALQHAQGTSKIRGIVVEPDPDAGDQGFGLELNAEAFRSMPSLQLLWVDRMNAFDENLQFPPELKWLRWAECPLKSLFDRKLDSALIVDLPHNGILQIRSSGSSRQYSGSFHIATDRVKVLDLSWCKNKDLCPDFKRFCFLEALILDSCSWENLASSIIKLDYLSRLSMRDNNSLKKLPDDFCEMKCLKLLDVSGCKNLRSLPERIGDITTLEELALNLTGIKKLPDSITKLRNLRNLSMVLCYALHGLPHSMRRLESMKELHIEGCHKIETLPVLPVSLVKLIAHDCVALTSVEDFSNMMNLEELDLTGCMKIENVSRIEKLKSERRMMFKCYLPFSITEVGISAQPDTQVKLVPGMLPAFDRKNLEMEYMVSLPFVTLDVGSRRMACIPPSRVVVVVAVDHSAGSLLPVLNVQIMVNHDGKQMIQRQVKLVAFYSGSVYYKYVSEENDPILPRLCSRHGNSIKFASQKIPIPLGSYKFAVAYMRFEYSAPSTKGTSGDQLGAPAGLMSPMDMRIISDGYFNGLTKMEVVGPKKLEVTN